MNTAHPKESVLGAHCGYFATSLLPLYAGSQVKICIGSENYEYRLSKNLICKQSPYFAAMFEGEFREGEEQSTKLDEIEGVVSKQSFELLVQWLYLGRVVFGALAADEEVTAAIEFVRIADMCGVIGMESTMAEHIKAILLANPDPESTRFGQGRVPDTNTHCLRSHHIISAAQLPEGHPVRGILAAASVEGYLRHDNHKFLKETREIPNFAVDVLKEVKATLKAVAVEDFVVRFKDPISGTKLRLG